MFVLKIDEMPRWGPAVRLEIASSAGEQVIEKKLIRKDDIVEEGVYERYTVPFTLQNDAEIEFRVYYMGTGTVYCEGVFLLNEQEGSPGTGDTLLETRVVEQ